jgi:hypothetical protein
MIQQEQVKYVKFFKEQATKRKEIIITQKISIFVHINSTRNQINEDKEKNNSII